MLRSILTPSIVQWRCRRGMLELDIFLQPFCQEIYPTLPEDEKKDFIDLLEENDMDLFQWLMAYQQSENLRFNHLINLIRAHRLC